MEEKVIDDDDDTSFNGCRGVGYNSVQRSRRRERRPTVPSEVRSKISNPGYVRINSKGAFISEDNSSASEESSEAEYEHDPRDIRLPNHTESVGHIAIDVCSSICKLKIDTLNVFE